MPGIEPKPGASPVSRSTGAVARRAPGEIPYEDAEAVGFDVVPGAVQQTLASASLLTGEMWVGTGDLVTKRRPDGSHFRDLQAWWASDRRFVKFRAIRELASAEQGRFRPQGTWAVRGTAFDFAAPVVPTSSVWRFQAPEQAVSQSPNARRNAGPLEVLPPQVALPVVGGEADAWRQYGRGWALETIAAFRLSQNRVCLLKAQREAASRRGLDLADWKVETADIAIRGPLPFVMEV